jgi:2-polyprenyl-3-methyl-5-hydroxy-6-metoxy-1,4-benzoquinol methylase
MKVKVENIAKNVKKNEDGIFYAKDSSTISYPESGNQECMQLEQDSFWFNHRNNVIIEGIKKFNGTKVFFDIGGGNGFVAKRIQESGFNVALVEPGIQGAKNAIERGINNVICSTIENAGFEKSSMDSVGLFDVVEHIENDVTFLTNVNNYLKEDGLLYITVPSFNFLWSNEDTEAGHFRRYTLRKMKAVLLESGYQIKYSTYIFSILPLPILLFRSIPSKLGIHKKSSELKKHQKEHKTKKGTVDRLLQKIWNWELRAIQKSKKISFGGSCFIIAEKMTKMNTID